MLSISSDSAAWPRVHGIMMKPLSRKAAAWGCLARRRTTCDDEVHRSLEERNGGVMQWDRAWDMMERQSCCIGSDRQCDTCDILSSFLTTTYQLHSIR